MVVGSICVGVVLRVRFEMRAQGGATSPFSLCACLEKIPCLQRFAAPSGVGYREFPCTESTERCRSSTATLWKRPWNFLVKCSLWMCKPAFWFHSDSPVAWDLNRHHCLDLCVLVTFFWSLPFRLLQVLLQHKQRTRSPWWGLWIFLCNRRLSIFHLLTAKHDSLSFGISINFLNYLWDSFLGCCLLKSSLLCDLLTKFKLVLASV